MSLSIRQPDPARDGIREVEEGHPNFIEVYFVPTPFREGVYTPSADLSGSINQALDQKYQFQKQIAQIKDNSRIYDIESYAVHCCLVIGKTPEGDDQKKSFELFRRNSKDVELVTFDELLEKLKQLSTFLRASDGTMTSQKTKVQADG